MKCNECIPNLLSTLHPIRFGMYERKVSDPKLSSYHKMQQDNFTQTLADDLPNVNICAKIYAYCKVTTTVIAADAYVQYDQAVHGSPVYVGQTIQELIRSNKQHLLTSYSVFDRQSTKQSQFRENFLEDLSTGTRQLGGFQ